MAKMDPVGCPSDHLETMSDFLEHLEGFLAILARVCRHDDRAHAGFFLSHHRGKDPLGEDSAQSRSCRAGSVSMTSTAAVQAAMTAGG